MTKPNEIIKARREMLRLTDVEVARAIGITIDSYFDLEFHSDELATVSLLKEVRNLCKVLELDALELFAIECPFCADPASYRPEYALPRNQLIAWARKECGFSHEDLARRLQWGNVSAVGTMEQNPEYLEKDGFDNIDELAKCLGIPTQLLLAVKCKVCGR